MPPAPQRRGRWMPPGGHRQGPEWGRDRQRGAERRAAAENRALGHGAAGPVHAASDGVDRPRARPGAGRGTPTRAGLTRRAPGAAGRSNRRAPGAPAAPAAGARRSRPPRSAAGPRTAGTPARPARKSASSRPPTTTPPTRPRAAPPRRRPQTGPGRPAVRVDRGPPAGISCARAVAGAPRRPSKRSRWIRADGHVRSSSFDEKSKGWLRPEATGPSSEKKSEAGGVGQARTRLAGYAFSAPHEDVKLKGK